MSYLFAFLFWKFPGNALTLVYLLIKVLCPFTELPIFIHAACYIFGKSKEVLSWRDLLQSMHRVTSTAIALIGFQCIYENFCLTVAFVLVVVQVQVSLNCLLCLFLLNRNNRPFLVVVQQ